MFTDKERTGSSGVKRKAVQTSSAKRDRVSVTALFLSLWAVCVLCVFITSKILFPGVSRGGLPDWAKDIEKSCRAERADWYAESDIYAEQSFAYVVLGDDRRPIEDSHLDDSIVSSSSNVSAENGKVVLAENATENAGANEQKSQPVGYRLHGIDVIGNASRKSFSLFGDNRCNNERHQGKYVIYITADDRIVKKGDLLYSTEITDHGDVRHFSPALYALLAYEEYIDKIECATANMRSLVSACIIMGAVLLAFGYCLFSMRSHLFDSIKELMLCGTCMFIHILCILLALVVSPKMGGGSSLSLFALMPLGLGAALTSNLLGRRVGTYTGILLSVITPLLLGGTFKFHLLIQAFMSSVIAIMMFHDVQKRTQYLLGGIVIMLNAVIFTLFYGFLRELPWLWEGFSPFWINILGLSAINALSIIMLVLLLTPVLEKLFGVTTFVTFKENYNQDHKLMKRLQNEAPGTFEHCITVARIAADAARAIGFDEQITESCAYFHDIGKLNDPKMYAENLLAGDENPHDKLSTLESCAILREHVRYGLELAKKNHLPPIIQETIEQHHGNGLMTGFYAKAARQAEEAGQAAPEKAEYSYTGRKPQRPEVVLVFLADFCEAAVRASVKHWEVPSSELVRQKIEELVDAKMREHQFDNSMLTMADMHKVIDRMVETFCTIYHLRPEYTQNKTVMYSSNHVNAIVEQGEKPKNEADKQNPPAEKQESPEGSNPKGVTEGK